MPSPDTASEIATLQQKVDTLQQKVAALQQTVKQLDVNDFSQDELLYIKSRLVLTSANYRTGSIYASKLALDPFVATVTAVNGYTPIYDSRGNLLKIATLT